MKSGFCLHLVGENRLNRGVLEVRAGKSGSLTVCFFLAAESGFGIEKQRVFRRNFDVQWKNCRSDFSSNTFCS